MADIKDMTREEIEQYLAKMPKDATKPSAGQETTVADALRGADGNYNLSKVNLNKMFVDKANERSYADENGEMKSYNKGTEWQAAMDKLPEDARNYIYQRLNEYKNKGRPLNKWDLREIEHSAKAKFGLPKSFDISSGAMFDSTMAKMLNSIDIPKVEATPVPTTETPKQKQVEQKPVEQKAPTTNDELNAAFKRIKNKKASDADLALFNKYSEEQLKKMGFGPISINAIKGTTQSSGELDDDAFMSLYTKNARKFIDDPNNKFLSDPATVKRYQEIVRKRKSANKLSDEDAAFMKKYKDYTQQLSGAQPRDPAGVKQMQESEAHKFVTDPANKKRYQALLEK